MRVHDAHSIPYFYFSRIREFEKYLSLFDDTEKIL